MTGIHLRTAPLEAAVSNAMNLLVGKRTYGTQQALYYGSVHQETKKVPILLSEKRRYPRDKKAKTTTINPSKTR